MSYFLHPTEFRKIDSMDSVASDMLEFKPNELDFFLLRSFSWDDIYAMVYFLKIGNAVFQVPSGLYILLADEYGTVDCMVVDEIIGRDVDILILDKDITTHTNEPAVVLDAKMKRHFWPNSNNIIPIVSECKKAVLLLSRTDQWKTTKAMSAYDFIG